MRWMTLATCIFTLFWTLSFGDLMPDPQRSCAKERCEERDFERGEDWDWQQGPPGVLPPDRSEINNRFVDRRALRSEQQFLRVLRDRQQNAHQFFRVLKRGGGDQFLRVLRAGQDRMPGEKTAGLQRELRGQQQFFRVLKREKPLQRESRAEAQFLRVLRSNHPEEEY